MARYKGDHWDKTHEAIIVAAAGMLRERGFDDTSVTEVMKAVGLTHGGFYAHFEDKTAMLVAALERAFVQSPKNFEFLATMANKQGNAGIIAEKYLSDTRVADVAGGCPGAALMSELQRQPDVIQATFEGGARSTAKALGGTNGLSAKADNHEAWAALSLLFGALSLMRAIPERSTRDTIRKQAIAGLRKLAE